MLTADLVEARPRGDQLRLTPLDNKRRAAAQALARTVLDTYAAAVGRTREELADAVGELPVSARERRLFAGLCKLIEDLATFEEGAVLDVPPEALRLSLFGAAAEARRRGDFDRARLVAEEAARHGTDTATLERGLYADLRGAEILRAVYPETPEALVARWSHAQVQAVLLRAVQVTVVVKAADPADQRALFRHLKFRRLLWQCERVQGPAKTAVQGPAKTSDLEGGAWRIVIDGPMSLFESVTKYGLELAMLVPVLDAMESYALTADLRWGKTKTPLRFEHSGGTGMRREDGSRALPDDVATLLARINALEGTWTAAVADEILELPGLGVVVPDLVLKRGKARVFVEVLGHWSRSAVWKRVELVEAGLKTPLVVCASERLRVSEDVLPEDAPASLYVYKGVMSAKALLDRADAVSGRAAKER